jgi:hypothetical protein
MSIPSWYTTIQDRNNMKLFFFMSKTAVTLKGILILICFVYKLF